MALWKFTQRENDLENQHFGTGSAWRDRFWNANMPIFIVMMIPFHSCVTKPLIVIVIHALGS